MNPWAIHDRARVRAGKYAGAVGRVVEVMAGATGVRLRLHLQGVVNGEVVDVVRSFAARDLEPAT
jgi:ribosomal protein L24